MPNIYVEFKHLKPFFYFLGEREKLEKHMLCLKIARNISTFILFLTSYLLFSGSIDNTTII